jgi:hypothetical protein
MFTPGFVIFSILLFITTLYLVAGDWNHVQTDTQAFYSFKGKTAYDIWVFWFLLMAIGAIHEFGHGLTCKHFGGEVHQMGFLLIYFTPAFYTDTTDILLFDRTSRRQWVIFAGMWIELVVCGLCTLLWHFSVPGTFVNDLAYKAMLLSGIEGTLFNLEPPDQSRWLLRPFAISRCRQPSRRLLRLCARLGATELTLRGYRVANGEPSAPPHLFDLRHHCAHLQRRHAGVIDFFPEERIGRQDGQLGLPSHIHRGFSYPSAHAAQRFCKYTRLVC